jgi:hypothetical protein
MVELRGLEPLTSSMPWWAGNRKRRAASVDGVWRRAGAATSVQPGSPSVCPPCLERSQCRAPIRSVGLDLASEPVRQLDGHAQNLATSPD